MKSTCLTTCCLLLLFALSTSAQIQLRAVYYFPDWAAWSAEPHLPAYRIVPLHKKGEPLDVTDTGTVLFKSDDRNFFRWIHGNWQELPLPANEHPYLSLTADGTVFGVDDPFNNPRLLRIPPHYRHYISMPAPPGAKSNRLVFSYRLGHNDNGGLILRSMFSDTHHVGNRRDNEIVYIRDHMNAHWRKLSEFTISTSEDYVIRQSGEKWRPRIFTNAGDLIGRFGSGYEVDYGDSPRDPVDEFNWEYRLNEQRDLPFEPVAANSSLTIIGITPGPVQRIVIQDAYGLRPLFPGKPDSIEDRILLSNPFDGREIIVQHNRVWHRMMDHEISGQSMGRVSADFWEGTLSDLIINSTAHWSGLEATCISKNGTIAGVGTFTDPETGLAESKPFVLLPAPFLPDWNRDGTINHLDRSANLSASTLRLWINDDRDKEEIEDASHDLPGFSEGNAYNESVDGLRDTIDFFPVYLDLRPMLKASPPGSLRMVLRHPDQAVNVLFSNLHPLDSGSAHAANLATGFGPYLNEPLAEARVVPVSASGTAIPEAFLQSLRDQNKGLLFLEGVRSTDKPLYLDILHHNKTVLSIPMPVTISPVRDMFRILNLRSDDHPRLFGVDPGPWLSRMEEPTNLPDSDFAPQTPAMLHIHGFNWEPEAVPAAHTEVFKRLYQSGLQNPFIGVTWHSDQGKVDLLDTSFDYNENVINAFLAAKLLARNMAGFPRPLQIFAHSLGNLVAASAIVDHRLPVERLFMVNAALPMEALDESWPGDRRMVHPDWKDRPGDDPHYLPRLRPDQWHALFDPSDPRSHLRWKGRFARLSQLTDCLHFYSSGEDVLLPGDGAIPDLFGEIILKRQGIWVYNEMAKGTDTLAASLTGDVHGGWGFNRHYMRSHDPNGPARPPARQWFPMAVTVANELPAQDLIATPFFKNFSDGDADFPNWGNGSWLYQSKRPDQLPPPGQSLQTAGSPELLNHAKILAEAVPAVSDAAGAVPPHNEPLFDAVDMDVTFRSIKTWPDRYDHEGKQRWLHSDFLQLAMPFVHRLFRATVGRINQ